MDSESEEILEAVHSRGRGVFGFIELRPDNVDREGSKNDIDNAAGRDVGRDAGDILGEAVNGIDPEAERIKEYSKVVSPQGAEKLTAQSIGVLIHVLNQVLRTNAAMLKLQGEQLALQNKREKLGPEQFKFQYESLAKAFGSLKPKYKLPALNAR